MKRKSCECFYTYTTFKTYGRTFGIDDVESYIHEYVHTLCCFTAYLCSLLLSFSVSIFYLSSSQFYSN